MTDAPKPRKPDPAYIGDGVYAVYEHGQIVLTTSDGRITTNRIVLEPEVYESLVEFAAKHWRTT